MSWILITADISTRKGAGQHHPVRSRGLASEPLSLFHSSRYIIPAVPAKAQNCNLLGRFDIGSVEAVLADRDVPGVCSSERDPDAFIFRG